MFRLKNKQDVYNIHVFYQVAKERGDDGLKLFDSIVLPNPLVDLTPKIFINSPLRKIEIPSQRVSGIKYILNIEWHEIGLNYRLADLLSKQRTEVSRKHEIVKNQIQ